MSTIGKTIDRRDDCHHALTARQTGFKPAWYFRWKDPLDRCAAVMLLVPGLPLIACLAVLVRLTSKGPGIYRQARVGKDGHRFMMYKIRTMRLDAETESRPGLDPATGSANDAVGKAAAQAPPRRIAATVQCPQGRDVAGGSASRTAGIRLRAGRSGSRLSEPAGRAARHHRTGPDQSSAGYATW